MSLYSSLSSSTNSGSDSSTFNPHGLFQAPLLHISTKHTDDVDFAPPFRQYIQSAYQDDPDKHAAAIAALNRARQDIRGAGKDIPGRDILYRYYGQLELLDLRFPVDGRNVKLLFNWYDAFTSKQVSQYSIAYEKASVIFNIGATCSSIGALQNRFEISGLKTAFNYFQAAAGLFQYINDNFLHPPSVDMSRDSVKCLSELMLGQAQECFIEKVLVEKKRGALVAKLSAQVALIYSGVVDGFLALSLKGQFDKSWIDLIRIKSNHFQALAHYHKSIQMEMENQYGDLAAHSVAADTIAKDNLKLVTLFVNNYPSFSVSKESNSTSVSSSGTKTSDAVAVADMVKSFAKTVAQRMQVSLKDNELIYHASIPDIDALAPIDKLNAVKTIPFVDLCANGRADISQIIGPDLFHALIPLSVHESASLYSEEKAKVLRGEQERARNADADLQATFDSLNMVPTLDRLKRFLKSDLGSVPIVKLSDVLKDASAMLLREEQGSNKIDYLVNMVDESKTKSSGVLSEVSLLLDKEQHECENKRVKYMDQWTMEPSFKLATSYRQEIREYHESLDKANETDKGLKKRITDTSAFVELFSRPYTEVESHFSKAISNAAGLATSTAPADRQAEKQISLLDERVDGIPTADGLGVLGEQIVIEKIDGILNRLRVLKKSRGDLVEELKKKLHDDDVSSLLLLNKGREQQIFQTELLKFRPIQSKLDGNLESHNVLLKDMTSEFTKLLRSSRGMRVLDARERARSDLVAEWSRQFGIYKEVKGGLTKGVEFYNDLAERVNGLRDKVVGFVNSRSSQAAALVATIESTQAERGQVALKEQLRLLSVSSASSASGPNVSPAMAAAMPSQQSTSGLTNSPIVSLPTEAYPANLQKQQYQAIQQSPMGLQPQLQQQSTQIQQSAHAFIGTNNNANPPMGIPPVHAAHSSPYGVQPSYTTTASPSQFHQQPQPQQQQQPYQLQEKQHQYPTQQTAPGYNMPGQQLQYSSLSRPPPSSFLPYQQQPSPPSLYQTYASSPAVNLPPPVAPPKLSQPYAPVSEHHSLPRSIAPAMPYGDVSGMTASGYVYSGPSTISTDGPSPYQQQQPYNHQQQQQLQQPYHQQQQLQQQPYQQQQQQQQLQQQPYQQHNAISPHLQSQYHSHASSSALHQQTSIPSTMSMPAQSPYPPQQQQQQQQAFTGAYLPNQASQGGPAIPYGGYPQQQQQGLSTMPATSGNLYGAAPNIPGLNAQHPPSLLD
ncbi:hypothetical protein BASA50_009973 [Batrachochytrium salamandrivorans]|uniref:BRO domain-containing protein 1 n=1 Tax=Batrachochytrium salamandrivorans TaxID=1357716 RepID=A0ABQ8EZU5_9FUNG|nr:hypothetical protein BASA62_007596 [Batrachochytrium salamandrivorans]KAH6576961.1 hypothetical protein BASA60_004304 [Batrachochytrium salamandrivorans]KAH6589562.1 hypothetical protein BASA50_009973 [Batrachochytrium salamandrivorans]KAH6600553.1 hypothetical protein BASA61_002263 [Batrachochytrium salamandrivorans]KAH9246168.1 hypothetical protein BASA81_016309 [Batrachochytrium salamandrivorans]